MEKLMKKNIILIIIAIILIIITILLINFYNLKLKPDIIIAILGLVVSLEINFYLYEQNKELALGNREHDIRLQQNEVLPYFICTHKGFITEELIESEGYDNVIEYIKKTYDEKTKVVERSPDKEFNDKKAWLFLVLENKGLNIAFNSEIENFYFNKERVGFFSRSNFTSEYGIVEEKSRFKATYPNQKIEFLICYSKKILETHVTCTLKFQNIYDNIYKQEVNIGHTAFTEPPKLCKK